MGESEDIKKAIIISILFASISSTVLLIVGLISRISISRHFGIKEILWNYLNENFLGIIVVFAIIATLLLYLKKYKSGIKSEISKSPIIILIVSLLLIIQGIFNISRIVPTFISSISEVRLEQNIGVMSRLPLLSTMSFRILLSDGISILIFLTQVVISLYSIYIYKKIVRIKEYETANKDLR